MDLSYFFTTLREKQESLPARQKKVCSAILTRHQEVAFMTVEQLADASGVSVGTVVRTTRALGFAHYADMGALLSQALIKRGASLWWQLEGTWGEKASKKKDLFVSIVQENIASIQQSCSAGNTVNIKKCIKMLRASHKIAVLGLRSTYGVASYFSHMLMEFRSDVINVGMIGSDSMYALLADLGKEDVLFAISLGGPHYVSRTIAAAKFAAENSVPVISLVSDYASPVTKYSDLVLTVSPTSTHYSVASAITVLEVVIAALGKEEKGAAQKKLKTLSNILKDSDVTL